MKMSIEDVAEVAVWAREYLEGLKKEQKEKIEVIRDLYLWLKEKASEAIGECDE